MNWPIFATNAGMLLSGVSTVKNSMQMILVGDSVLHVAR